MASAIIVTESSYFSSTGFTTTIHSIPTSSVVTTHTTRLLSTTSLLKDYLSTIATSSGDTTKGTKNMKSITIPSSIMGSDSHSDNHQTKSTNSNVPNTQFNTIKNTIKTTDRTIVSDKTTNTAPLVPSKTESIISTTARGPTIQSSTGDNNTTTLIAAVISTVLILLVVSILVIIIVSVLMYKRRKRLTLKISSRGDGNHATSTMRKDEEEMSNNPSYQPQGIHMHTYKYYQHYSCTVTLHEEPINSTITDNPSYGVNGRRNQGSKLIYYLFH